MPVGTATDLFAALKPILFMLLTLAVILGLVSPGKAIGRILAMAILVPMEIRIEGGSLRSLVERADGGRKVSEPFPCEP